MFLFTIVIILSVFAFELLLSILNYRNRKSIIPAVVSDVYDKKEYEKWLSYTMEVFRINMVSKISNTTFLIAFLSLKLFPLIADISSQITGNSKIQILLFFAIYGLIAYCLDIGFSVYRTFVIEEKYGFNQTTFKTFVLDQIKSTLLVTILGGGLLYLVLSLYDKLGVKSLFYTYFIMIGIMLLINLLYAKVFIKIFNKITPLDQGPLYDKCMALAKKSGYEIKQISVMDASKRSSRLNAFFSGFGKFKSIVLYDTLIEKCSDEEIVSVLAHEIGHSIYKDVFRNFMTSIVSIGFYMYVLSYFLTSQAFSSAFGFETIHLGFALILFSILLEPLGILLGIPMSAWSRKAEYRADAYAAKMGYQSAMISALKVLSKENFSNLTPHPLLVKFTYTHPPTADRIIALNKKSH